MDIKRGSERKNLKVFLKTLDMKTDQIFGYVVDITKEGIMLTREKSVTLDDVFQLRVVLPAEIEGKKEIDFSAKSRWAQEDSESEFYNIGFQFMNLSPTDMQIIDNLIQNFCFDTDAE